MKSAMLTIALCLTNRKQEHKRHYFNIKSNITLIYSAVSKVIGSKRKNCEVKKMKLSEKLRLLKSRFKSYFVSDQTQSLVLFVEDFFPSEKIFGLFGFSYLKRLHNNVDKKNQYRRQSLFWISFVNSAIILLLSAINFIQIIVKKENFVEGLESFSWIGGSFFILIKSFFLCYWKHDTIRAIVKRLDQNFSHSSRDQLKFGVQKHHHYLNIHDKLTLASSFSNCLHYSCMALTTLFIGGKIELLTPVYFPLDPLQPLLYPIFFVIQFVSHRWNLMFLVKKIAQLDPDSDENVEKKVREVIDHYYELTDIANELEDIFSPLLFINFFAGIFVLCVFIFVLFTPLKVFLSIKFITALITLLIQLFCTCYYGELLQTASMRVADEAYNCNWYGRNLKFRRMILLTMLRAQRPQVLTGRKFMNIGLPIFYWALQTTHSYYSLLSGLYEA
ncbi:hypothetical protein PVAND_000825 [Polypedilum vanderplanki]|uniref:Odorant receptor n=1 Tax=Polypedilum vanderplanki TaxID=319348 RepID=A0A9J6BL37_POLVA|nr:hypothetical protein PVAND_000825 [Polypedilum vanderplanki]